uniref:Uncharacterized protein n=1 Tax=uncultured prokaryote TaxID=198431 RepID=A0A0H5QL42_9ZZZZ|nr:hypothetical protein [uncultured prokaryote]
MAKTYQPTLRLLAHQISVFIARWRIGLQAGLTPEQAVALATFEVGLTGLLTALGAAPIED